MSLLAYTGLVAAIAIERLFELGLSRRNERAQFRAGGIEHGAGHYPIMVTLHVGLLVGSVAESWLLARPFIPALGYPMLGLVLAAAAGRFWVISTLGDRWTTRVVVVPGQARITSGPYRFIDHPNYLIVVIEGFALPLVYTNWISAVAFTAANTFLLSIRIRVENEALAAAVGEA